jgi:hypothetical protein
MGHWVYLIPVDLFLGHASKIIGHHAIKRSRFNLGSRDCPSNFRCAAIRSAVVVASNAIRYAKFYSNAVIRAYDNAGNVTETHERWRQAAASIFVGNGPVAQRLEQGTHNSRKSFCVVFHCVAQQRQR